ncbi:hypothetical protein CCACVL1_28763 [Corchorus capsularis]|uniref:Uncharacterized protein n=1 Tax=Corchorus capsularis TaxID=210143 RepID=A0A1R3G598_COCAP|nr:hypothetical protein CCACVL1_28763 [Corchorus capsularis]
MSAFSISKFIITDFLSSTTTQASASPKFPCFPLLQKSVSFPHSASHSQRKIVTFVSSKSSEAEEVPAAEDEWLNRLPDKNKPLYSHSLPCIEAWLRSLGFYQSREDRAVWLIEKPDWHAHLSLDVTDLYIRYLKSGPGNLERDMERRFSYALSREDIENAILGGP